MKLFTCTDHDCINLVGVASIVVAEDEAAARALLSAALTSAHLSPDDFTLEEVAIDKPQAIILRDGDY